MEQDVTPNTFPRRALWCMHGHWYWRGIIRSDLMVQCIDCHHYSRKYGTCDATGIEEDIEEPEIEIRCDFFERR